MNSASCVPGLARVATSDIATLCCAVPFPAWLTSSNARSRRVYLRPDGGQAAGPRISTLLMIFSLCRRATQAPTFCTADPGSCSDWRPSQRSAFSLRFQEHGFFLRPSTPASPRLCPARACAAAAPNGGGGSAQTVGRAGG